MFFEFKCVVERTLDEQQSADVYESWLFVYKTVENLVHVCDTGCIFALILHKSQYSYQYVGVSNN